jgi:hypothetical protein
MQIRGTVIVIIMRAIFRLHPRRCCAVPALENAHACKMYMGKWGHTHQQVGLDNLCRIYVRTPLRGSSAVDSSGSGAKW